MLFVTFRNISLSGSSQTLNDCPAGIPRDKYLTVHGGVCYDFYVEPGYELDYVSANEDCNSRGGSIVLVKSKDVSDYLINQLIYEYGDASPIWIGLTDKTTEGTYVWEDGTPLGSDYTNWDPSRNGTSASHDCVYLNPGKNGLWNEDNCEDSFFGLFAHERPYVCQYRPRPGSEATTVAA